MIRKILFKDFTSIQFFSYKIFILSINMFDVIDDFYDPTIHQYFSNLNRGEFMTAAKLFAEQGCLNPPFEKSIQGRSAIAQYLESEAKGMRFCPEQGQMMSQDDQETRYRIRGKVETNWFTVNVNWSIQLNSMKEIIVVDVNLMASMTDLLHFNTLKPPVL
jgi:hypothetical protein